MHALESDCGGWTLVFKYDGVNPLANENADEQSALEDLQTLQSTGSAKYSDAAYMFVCLLPSFFIFLIFF